MDPIKEQYKEVMRQKREDTRHKQQLDRISSLEKTVVSTMKQLVGFLDGKTTKTEVVNQLKEIGTPDVDKVVKALEKLDKSVTSGKVDLTPLKDGFNALEQQLKKLPTEFPEMPEAPESVVVKNQIDIDPLLKALKALKLDPKINVAAPDVKVDAPDLSPILKPLETLIKAVNDKEIPKTDLGNVEKKLDEANKHLKAITEKRFGGGGGGGGNGTPYVDSTGKPVNVVLEDDGSIPVTGVYSKPTDAYALSNIDEGATYEYYGYEAANLGWYIKRLTVATNVFEFAKGPSAYATAWTGRAGQTYASYGVTF